MSRVARIPVSVAKGVDVQVSASHITVKGPLGTLQQPTSARVKVSVADGQVSFDAVDESREANAMSGTLRALVAAMVQAYRRVTRRSCRWSASAIAPRRRATSSICRSVFRIRSFTRCRLA
jgi:hypothetical protein